MTPPSGEGEGESEFACSGCEKRCASSYAIRDGAIASLDGSLCPKGALSSSPYY
ncbi:MAG TPA: hypothetical protein PK179_08545 [Spirochaetales bacterium]|nr:hypothetical protein [Spirochaetales bacterium]HPM73288.1 hypothetical protein [Spirochaetales bacterium]